MRIICVLRETNMFMKKLLFLLFLSPFFSLKSNAADGDSIWSANFIHDIYLNFSQPSYYDSLINTHVNDTYMSCDVIFDGRTMPTIGVKFKGNSSFNNPSVKKSMKLDFNYYVPGQDFDGIKKVNLNNGFKDPSFLREKIALDFMNSHGVFSPRCTYARVYFNNIYWGLYDLVEEVDSKFLKQRFPDDDGNLYKGDPSGDTKWYGSAASAYYSHYELNSSSTVINWSDLVQLLNLANNSAPSVYFDTLETVLDSWSFLNYMAAQNLFANLDSYAGSGHNYYTYSDSTYFKFHWIAWDVNEAFGNFNMSMSIPQIQNLNYDYLGQASNRPLGQKMLADATYRSMYISSLCAMSADFTNANLDSKIDSLVNLIRPDVYADPNKFFTNAQFENNIIMNVNNTPGIKTFIMARNASLTTQLAPFGCWLGTNETMTAVSQLSVFPNPSATTVTISLPQNWNLSDCFLQIYDVTGNVIATENILNFVDNNYLIATERMANGIYLLSVTNGNGENKRTPIAVIH